MTENKKSFFEEYALKLIQKYFSRPNIAIDLGTANTLVYITGKGIILSEPSIVAMKVEKGNFIPYAFGSQAKLMVGKTPEKIKIIRPLKDGVVADFQAAEEMIRHYINSVRKTTTGFFNFLRPRIVICVPSTATAVEKRAIQDAAESAGASEAYLIEEPMAAAIGAELRVEDPCGSMIVDIGGGTTEIAVISLGGIVYGYSLRVGGDKMDEAIISYLRKNHGLLIGDSTAEKIKKMIGSACPVEYDAENRSTTIRGRSIEDGIPKEIQITENDVAFALKDIIAQIIESIKIALEQTPPELAADISEKGITLTGGGALLKRLDGVIANAVSLKVKIADDPLDCVARGSGKVLENIDKLGNVLFRQD